MPLHPDIASKLHLVADIPSAETVAGPHGPVPVRVYEPQGDGPHPCLVWVHGGGFIGGDLDMPEGDWVGRDLCDEFGVLVVMSTTALRSAACTIRFRSTM